MHVMYRQTGDNIIGVYFFKAHFYQNAAFKVHFI